MIEVSNTLFIVLVHFIYLLGRLFARLNVFLQKQFDIPTQIFPNLQHFPRPWIAKIASFFMSASRMS